MPISVLIADDEASGRQNLRRLIRGERDVDIVAECGTGTDALAQIVATQPDVAFLDIQMPGMTGLELVETLRDMASPPLIVFATAHDEYAVRAFRVQAFDYLLKPVDKAQFDQVMQRIRSHLTDRGSALMGRKLAQMLEDLGSDPALPPSGPARAAAPMLASRTCLERIAVRHNERIIFIKVSDVDWFQATGNYVRLHVQKSVFQIRDTLGRLESQLDPSQFARIHRQVIVNLNRVRELQPWFTGDFIVKLVDGTELRMSRTYRGVLNDSLYKLKSS